MTEPSKEDIHSQMEPVIVALEKKGIQFNSREEEFKREASLSKEQQKKMESQKSPPFEEYLAEFLNKVS